eukprot:12334346-Ditylum_brightwellii.AAC.1
MDRIVSKEKYRHQSAGERAHGKNKFCSIPQGSHSGIYTSWRYSTHMTKGYDTKIEGFHSYGEALDHLQAYMLKEP